MDARVAVACLAAAALDAAAGGIYKCVDRGATTYQSAPCARGQDEVPVSIAVSPLPARTEAATVSITPPQARKRGPWTRTVVEVGISDDEVLNMPGWGRPTQISRARIARGWEEVWRYGNSYSGERALRFVNARLTDIGQTPAAIASAR